MPDYQNTFVPNLLTLRHCVLALGEQHHWWGSNLLSEDSYAFLEYVVPRTTQAAALVAATEVGRTKHDQVIGAGKLHLFRLPQALEEKAFQQLYHGKNAIELAKGIHGHELSKLEELSQLIAISEQQGPVHIGSPSELKDDKILAVFAKHYREAFLNGYQTFPYLT